MSIDEKKMLNCSHFTFQRLDLPQAMMNPAAKSGLDFQELARGGETLLLLFSLFTFSSHPLTVVMNLSSQIYLIVFFLFVGERNYSCSFLVNLDSDLLR